LVRGREAQSRKNRRDHGFCDQSAVSRSSAADGRDDNARGRLRKRHQRWRDAFGTRFPWIDQRVLGAEGFPPILSDKRGRSSRHAGRADVGNDQVGLTRLYSLRRRPLLTKFVRSRTDEGTLTAAARRVLNRTFFSPPQQGRRVSRLLAGVRAGGSRERLQ